MANQLTINIGAAANDGTGDPLRTAFNEVNLNFANVWTTGLPNSNVQFNNNRILTVNTNANLVLAPNGTGVVQSNVSILPSIDRVHDLGSSTRKWDTLWVWYGQMNYANIGSANIASASNLTVDVDNLHILGGSNGYVLQTDGEGNLTWTAQTGGGNGVPGGANTQVQFNNAGSFGGNANFTFNNVNGNLQTAGNVFPSANAQNILGTPVRRWANVFTAQLNATGRIFTSGDIFSNGSISTSSDISANNATIGNITTSHNVYANVGTFYGDQYGDGAIYVGTPAGTVLGSDVVMQITANSSTYSQINFQNINTGNLASGDYIITGDQGDDSTYYLNLGLASSNHADSEFFGDTSSKNDGYLYVTATDQAGPSGGVGNLILGSTNGVIKMFVGNTAQANVIATVSSSGMSVSGNIIPSGNAVYSLGNATNQWNDLYVSNATIFMNNVPISLGVGNVLTVNGNAVLQNNSNSTISTTGNITANYFIGNGSQLTGLAPTYGNANVANYLPTFSGNIAAGNVSATGNISGAYVKGNGSELTNLPAPAVTQDITSNGAMSIMTYDGTIKYVNYATVEPSSGNIAAGNISTTGNISGNYVLGNGSQLTGLPAQYGNANVTALLGNLGSNVISGTGNIVSNNITIIGTTQTINARETLTLAAGGQFNICTILTGGSGYDTGSALKATTGGSGSGMTVGIGYGLSNQLTNADVVDPGTGYVDGDVITVSGGTGGTFVITRYNEQANQANNNFIESNWVFGNAGNLTLPGNTFAVNYANGTPISLGGGANTGNVTFSNQIVLGTGTNDGSGGLYLAPGTDSIANSAVQYLRVRGGDALTHIHLDTGNNAYYDQYFGNDNKFVKLEAGDAGNVVVGTDDNGNSYNWTFDTAGNLTLPGNTIAINYANGNLAFGTVTFNNEAVIGTGTSNTVSGLYLAPDPVSLTNDLYLRVRGNILDEPTHIHFDTGNNQYYNQYIGDDNKYILLANTGNVVVNTNDNAGNSAQWIFNNFGTLSLPGGSQIRPLGANLDIIAGTGAYVNLTTSDESSSMGVAGSGGYVTTAGGTWNFNTNGNLTAPGNISAVGNVTGGNIVTSGSGGNITLTGGDILGAGNISATGNITAANFFGNGNTLSNVATTFESTWTVPTGNSTQSFTVTPNNTYYLWVDCNIPNGILTWNATATVTNTNVPVVGAQYAWVYNGGGTPIDFTSIPNQFIGTANTIVRSSVAPSATTNRFDFGINNTSGNTVTVNYGYARIS